ncbi:DUF3800 domain-containing protein [Clostridium sp.]|uniref:DUF3800 domain-containing protein n=1 Tax=Clostridium sp. TaxID=1506 RepID=UPI0032176FDD
MYLLYIDDSGTCDLKTEDSYCITGGNTRFFALGAILIKADKLCELEYGSKIEFKSKCLKDLYGEIKYTISKQQLNCRELCNNNEGRECFKSKVLESIVSTECVVFSCIQDKYFTTSNKIIQNQKDIYKLSFEHLLSLVDNYMYSEKISDSIIVFIDKKDAGDSKDRMIFKAYKEAINKKNIFKAFSSTMFCPSINIVYSKYSLGAQLADFVAGSTWKAFESKNDETLYKEAVKITKRLGTKMYKDTNMKNSGFTLCKNWLK